MSTVRIQVRRGTASEWTSANPTLAAGELGVETDTRKIKVGTGSTAWTSLSYIASDAPGITEIAQDAIDQALSMGSGLTKSYNDGTNTISLGIDSTVVALKSYVDDQITGLDNAAAADYVLLADVGNAGGPAKLNVDGNLLVPKSSIILEGATANDFETTLTVVDPTADNTITFPDATTTVVGTDTIQTLSNKTLTTPTINGPEITATGGTPRLHGAYFPDGHFITFEGTTTNEFETVLSVVDPTADRTITLPDASGTVVLADNSGNVTVSGNLTVSGDTTTLNVSELLVEDNEIVLNSNVATGAPTLSASVSVRRGSSNPAFIQWNETNDQWVANYGEANSKPLATLNDLSSTETSLQGYADSAIGVHNLDTTNVHGIDDTAALATKTYADGAVNTHNLDTTSVHGIADTAALATMTYADQAVSTHNSDTTNVHGIGDTADLATKTYADTAASSAVSTHNDDTTNVHGIADTAALATKTYADNAVTQEAITTASNLGTAVSNHNSATTSVHGIADTAALATKTYVDNADNLKSNIAGPTFTGTVTIPTLSVTTTATGITATMVGLGNVDNTSDANKPVSTATQTALDAKASLSGAVFTGSVEIDQNLIVDGNLTVNGTNFAASATSITIEDNMLQLAHENGANSVDLGLVVAYNDGAAKHSGIVRDVSDDKWKLFKGVTSEPSTTVNFGQGSLDNLAVAALEATTVTPSSGVVFSDGTQTKEGVPSRTPIIYKTANYTLSAASERDSLIEVDSTSPVTITIPTNSAVAYPVGTTLDILGTNTGLITIAGDTGVTVNATPGLKLRTQWSSATLFKRAENSWVVYGDLKA